jgi:hypothetical protein
MILRNCKSTGFRLTPLGLSGNDTVHAAHEQFTKVQQRVSTGCKYDRVISVPRALAW